VRIQYHFRGGQTGLDAWDVHRLIELSGDLPVIEIGLDAISEIDAKYWFFDRPDRPSVRDIVDHVRLILAVDPSYPIILGPDGRVMDGMHRVARALLEGRMSIRCVRFEKLPEPDFRNCRPEDLPY
jgi:hypothetical protein